MVCYYNGLPYDEYETECIGRTIQQCVGGEWQDSGMPCPGDPQFRGKLVLTAAEWAAYDATMKGKIPILWARPHPDDGNTVIVETERVRRTYVSMRGIWVLTETPRRVVAPR